MAKRRRAETIRELVVPQLKVGDLYHVWWDTGNDEQPNMAVVMAILPYHGLYSEHFDAVLRLSAPKTRRGWMEMAVRLDG